MSELGNSAVYRSIRMMSVLGTFETCPRTRIIPVYWGGSEVVDPWPKRRD
jgi:hypothetical protein